MTLTSRSRSLLNSCSAPNILIEFTNPRVSYTTGELIEGTVTITVNAETRYSDVNISLEGSSRVNLLQPIATQRETGVSHTFITLCQPVAAANCPASRVFRPGKAYRFPYTFIIPDRLPLKSCSHRSTHTGIKQAHTKAPPTLHLKTLSQSLCEISYLIRVTVRCQNSNNNEKPCTLASCTKRLHLVPAHGEGDSFDRPMKPDMYTSSVVQELKGQWKRQTIGRLEAVAAIQQPIQVPSGRSPIDTVIAHVGVQLRFEPVRDTLPPRLTKIHPTLKQSTLFSTQPQEDFPSLDKILCDQMSRGAHIQIRSLPSKTISSIRWTKHTLPRHLGSSGIGQSSQPSSIKDFTPSHTSTPGCFYTASAMVPITLPSNSDLVPTFHSCFLSRIYTLELRLSYHMPGAPILQRAVALEVPIKVAGVSILDKSSDTLPNYNLSTEDKLSHIVSPPMLCSLEGKTWGRKDPKSAPRDLSFLPSSEWQEAYAPPKYDDVVAQSAKWP
ncbi:hypothetical protein BDV32DRAFT_148228 [Aspergillus pseudonomiae]|uniref:Uncharacterized protein n=1 Tax=Aspergillus pseudonomiae TaxID=1506151 RepID=A0A5N6I766_9EURO|nr:uncharacterized protein BDV37DRAFT_280426 [Aspergillus pseudonomiae]KAB8261580.1 hypothetical protein BDV32DRAFT_148228 [Aspergillus pseudonomiae]KAE8406815.1 hypothetical protein BDV37DRAFT_280426 [Aspergillus pseudonomiae]